MTDMNIRYQAPRFAVILLTNERIEIAEQGVMLQTTFQKLFLDPYELSGERYNPGKNATIRGTLIATNRATVVLVPIWEWKAQDETLRLLCQASDDGSPPAFSVFSSSEDDFWNQLSRELNQQ